HLGHDDAGEQLDDLPLPLRAIPGAGGEGLDLGQQGAQASPQLVACGHGLQIVGIHGSALGVRLAPALLITLPRPAIRCNAPRAAPVARRRLPAFRQSRQEFQVGACTPTRDVIAFVPLARRSRWPPIPPPIPSRCCYAMPALSCAASSRPASPRVPKRSSKPTPLWPPILTLPSS